MDARTRNALAHFEDLFGTAIRPMSETVRTGPHRLLAPIRIAVVDSGVDVRHPRLREFLARDGRDKPLSFDAHSGVQAPVDLSGHGTHVAGIISGTLQAAGVPHELLPVRCLGPNGRGQRSAVVAAIRWAAEHGARIINLSVVEERYDAAVDAAIQHAWEHGALLMAAGGNTGRDEVLFPAGYLHVLGVAATDDAGRPWQGATRGEHVSLAAPGVNRRAALPTSVCLLDPYGSGEGRLTGSSQAAALVTAVAAQLWGRHPGQSNCELYAHLLRLAATAGDGWEPARGYGVITQAAAPQGGVVPRTGGLVVQTDAPEVCVGDAVHVPGAGGIVRVRNLAPGGYAVNGRIVRVDAGTDTVIRL